MNYSFVKVTSFYRDYLDQYYSKNPEIVKAEYIGQYQHLMYDSFGWADFFQQNLSMMGIKAYEIIFNAKPLQQEWALENSTELRGKELIIFQLKLLEPDIVFFQDTVNFNGEWIEYLKREVPSIKKVIGWCCNPFTLKQIEMFKHFDFMVACSPLFSQIFNNNGLKTYVMPHAFEPKILERIKYSTNDKKDITFIGSLIPNADFHDYRTSIIEELLSSDVNLSVYTKLIHISTPMVVSQKILYFLTKRLLKSGYKGKILNIPMIKKMIPLKEAPKKPNYSDRLVKSADKPAYGLDMYNITNNSRINLNIHGGIAGEYAANMRIFESTGVATCLVTDWKKNLNEFFVEDEEIITFKSSEECIEKVKWLLNNQNEIEKISLAGQKRTLKDHNFKVRAEQLNEIILNELKY